MKGTQKEQEDKHNKMAFFYYEKFRICDAEELKGIYKNYKEYPEEAQVALKRLETESGSI